VSYGCYAGQVRNRKLAFPNRVHGLRNCVVFYRPLGFTTTLAFLESQVPFQRDEESLLKALELFERSRALWTREKEEFSAVRRAEKAAGRRNLSHGTRNVYQLDRWHADPQAGALFALDHWLRTERPEFGAADVVNHPQIAGVDALVAACRAGNIGGDFTARLAALRRELTVDWLIGTWSADPVGFRRRGRLRAVLGHIAVALETRPEVG